MRNDTSVDDEEGAEFADAAAACAHAMSAARDLVCVSIHDHGDVNLGHYIDVTDEAGRNVITVTFWDAFTITG